VIVGSIVGSAIVSSIVGSAIVGSIVVSAIIGSIVGYAISTLELSLFLFFPFLVVDNSAVAGTRIYMPLSSFPAWLQEDGEVMEHFLFPACNCSMAVNFAIGALTFVAVSGSTASSVSTVSSVSS